MADGVFSPDGKLMWTGEEWIPAPPKGDSPVPHNTSTQSGDIRDSVIMGDVNRQITNNMTTNVTQITAEEIASAMAQAMQNFDESRKQNEHGAKTTEIDQIELPGKGEWMIPESELSITDGVKVIDGKAAIFTSVWGSTCKFNQGTVVRDSVVIGGSYDYSCTIIDSLIAKDVTAGKNVMIHNCVIHGDTKIGENSILRNCVVKSGIEIPEGSNYEWVKFG